MDALWQRLRQFVVDRVLGLHDTPHRIAWGVAVGTFISMTPTIGIQVLLYLAAATALRANRVSGIPILLLSNPFTAIPLYYGEWRIGMFLLGGSGDGTEGARLETALSRLLAPDLSATLTSWTYWEELVLLMVGLGGELWLGSCVVGVVLGAPLYFASKRAVFAFRRHRAERHGDEQDVRSAD